MNKKPESAGVVLLLAFAAMVGLCGWLINKLPPKPDGAKTQIKADNVTAAQTRGTVVPEVAEQSHGEQLLRREAQHQRGLALLAEKGPDSLAAEEALRSAAGYVTSLDDQLPQNLADANQVLARIQIAREENEEGLTRLRFAAHLLAQRRGKKHADVIRARQDLALFYARQGRLTRAETELQQILESGNENLDWEIAENFETRRVLAAVRCAQFQPAAARASLLKTSERLTENPAARQVVLNLVRQVDDFCAHSTDAQIRALLHFYAAHRFLNANHAKTIAFKRRFDTSRK